MRPRTIGGPFRPFDLGQRYESCRAAALVPQALEECQAFQQVRFDLLIRIQGHQEASEPVQRLCQQRLFDTCSVLQGAFKERHGLADSAPQPPVLRECQAETQGAQGGALPSCLLLALGTFQEKL